MQSSDAIWYSDNATGKLYKAAKKSDGSLEKSKLITQSVLIRAGKVSCDGKFLALDFVKYASDGCKFTTGVFDVQSGRIIKLKNSGVKDSVLLKKGSEYYLVCFRYKAQQSFIDSYKVLFNKKNKYAKIRNCRWDSPAVFYAVKNQQDIYFQRGN